jgi:hypothetical protein
MMVIFFHPQFLIGLLIWVGAAWIIGQLGRNRRYGFLGNFLISFFFSPIVGVLVLLAGDERKSGTGT